MGGDGLNRKEKVRATQDGVAFVNCCICVRGTIIQFYATLYTGHFTICTLEYRIINYTNTNQLNSHHTQ